MRKHGKANTKIYHVFLTIKQRCLNIKNKDYKDYGGRGISICEEWLDKECGFINFYNWSIKNGYEEGLTIDRINVNCGYEPSNCRWITNAEQQKNKRNTIYIEFKNRTVTLSELIELTGIDRKTIEMRYIRGDRGERLIRPVRKRTA